MPEAVIAAVPEAVVRSLEGIADLLRGWLSRPPG
jgi:hypothetical protein